MSLLPSERFFLKQKTAQDTLFSGLGRLFGIYVPIVECFQKLTDLNLKATRTTLADIQEHVGNLLSVKDPQQLATLQMNLAAPTAERIHSYSCQAAAIAAQMRADFTKVAEAHGDAHRSMMQTLVADLGRTAPTGSDVAIVALKSTIAASNAFYDTVHRASRQAVEAVEMNFNGIAAAAHSAKLNCGQTSSAVTK